MTDLPGPDPSTRRLTPWPKRKPWSSWAWVALAVILMVAYLVVRAFT